MRNDDPFAQPPQAVAGMLGHVDAPLALYIDQLMQPSEKFAFQRTSQRGNLSECLEEILIMTLYQTDHRQ